MSQDLEDLLAREGHDDADALMDWAREHASSLASDLEGDDELGPLLGAGGVAGDAPPQSEAEARRLEQVALTARREASNAAPLPPIPVSTPAVPTDELDVEEIEELDMEELEMVDEDEDEPTGAGPAPVPPGPPGVEAPETASASQESEVGSDVGSEEESEAGADEDSAAAAEDAGETNSFGPPDGNEHVPEWKAALLSTQTESDQEAAERVKEASTAGPLPEMEFPQGDDSRSSARLEAEDDEISQHSVDLSDLDTDDE